MKPPWKQPGWLEQAGDWIEVELEQLGASVTGAIERWHERPWSIVLCVPTEKGKLFFKASAAALAHEAAVTQALAGWEPDCLPEVLATNTQHGWMLMHDGGISLRPVIKADRDLGHWKRLLPRYAEMQIEIAERIPDLLALGLPDRRLAKLPNLYQELLERTEVLRLDLLDGLTNAEHQHLIDLAPTLAELCQRLAASPVPESVHHGDFHDGNIFLHDGRYIFFDWGDASAAHPFFSLRTTFVSLEFTLGYDEDAPEFEALRDAYLEPWTKYDTQKGLKKTFGFTERTSPIASALGWAQAVSALEEAVSADYADAVPSLLKEFLTYMDHATK